MAQPTLAGIRALKRIGRFLLGAPRTVAVYERQPWPGVISVLSDSDHQGCLVSRRSTSCTVIMHGKHWLRSSSTTQKGISLSTGESEFHAIVKSASILLGMRTLCADWGLLDLQYHLHVDATAGRGIASRRGVGRVRHLHGPLLWVQQFVEAKAFEIKKIPGPSNGADLGTKHVGSKLMWEHLGRLGFIKASGRSRLALKAQL